MPLPISGGRSAGDALMQLKDELLQNWDSAIPRDAIGQPMDHEGGVRALLDFAQGGGLGGEDETGSVSAGANGFTLRRAGQAKANAMGPPQDKWSLTVNPSARSAEFKRGDFAIGGKWSAMDPSVSIRKGGLRLMGGNGFAPGANGPGAAGYGPVLQTSSPERGLWGSIGFTSGRKASPDPEEVQQFRASQVVRGAVSPFEPVDRERVPMSARQELEEQLGDYRARNPYWYRP